MEGGGLWQRRGQPGCRACLTRIIEFFFPTSHVSTVREITDALSDPLTLPSPQRGEGTSDSYFSNGAYSKPIELPPF